MNYRDRVFLSVAANLSFSKAAATLFISQPAVTNHIKALEEHLNISLFNREGNRISLTQAGKMTYEALKKIELQYRDLTFEIGKLNNAFKGVFKIGASSTISQYLIPQVMASFHKRYPKIVLHLISGNSSEMEKRLLNNEIDLALIENKSSQQHLNYHDFLDDELLIITGINSLYAKRRKISINEFKKMPLVLREKGSGTLEVIEESLRRRGISVDNLNPVVRLGSTEAIKNFLQCFDGIAIVSEKAIDLELYTNKVIQLKVKDINIHRKFRIVLRQGHPNYASKMFMEFLYSYNL